MFSLAHICTTKERERATACILHDAEAIALGIGVSLVDELLDSENLLIINKTKHPTKGEKMAQYGRTRVLANEE